ncbi:MAG: hypothetical protein ABEJ03_02830 [Candidatus Nanohaloarchaea archaeon]
MEEEFEELAEYLDQCYERARKLSDALTNHPDLKYSRGESYPFATEGKSRAWAEANSRLYSILLRDAMTSFHDKMLEVRKYLDGPNKKHSRTRRQEEVFRQRLEELEDRYKDIEDSVGGMCLSMDSHFETTVFEGERVLKPVGGPELKVTADQ